MEKKSRKKTFLAASVAGLLAMTGALVASSAVYAADIQCTGVNACKGQGECGGKDHGCAGKNACKGQGWISYATEELCTKAGGTILPAMPAAQ